MSHPVRVLLLEDDDADAELVTRKLARAGFDIRVTRAVDRRGFEAALGGVFDIVVADYQLPDMNALQAVALLRERGRDVPVLLVTGAITEDVAALLLQEGCSDYVLKDHLSRLPGAFAQCLEKQRLADRTRRAESSLRQRETRFRALIDNSTEAIALVNHDGVILEMLGMRALGYRDEEVRGRPAFDLIHPDDVARARSMFEDLAQDPGGFRAAEFRGLHRSGSWVWLEAHARNLLAEPALQCVLLTIRDVSERHRMLEALEDSRESLRANATLLESINRAMGAFLSGTAWEAVHRQLLRDLRAFLGCLQVFSFLLLDGAAPIPCLEPARGLLADGACAGVLDDLFRRMASSPAPVRVGRPCACMEECCSMLAVPIVVGAELRGMLGLVRGAEPEAAQEQSRLESFAQTLGVLHENHRRVLQHDLLERELLQSQKMEAVGRLAGGVAPAGLAVVEKQPGPVDLLMTDVVMPGLNGRELIEAARAMRPGIRVLFMSGYTDDAVLRAGVEWQKVPFVQKPFTRACLLSRVEEALAQPPAGARARLTNPPHAAVQPARLRSKKSQEASTSVLGE